jgi:hypothetical protein
MSFLPFYTIYTKNKSKEQAATLDDDTMITDAEEQEEEKFRKRCFKRISPTDFTDTSSTMVKTDNSNTNNNNNNNNNKITKTDYVKYFIDPDLLKNKNSNSIEEMEEDKNGNSKEFEGNLSTLTTNFAPIQAEFIGISGKNIRRCQFLRSEQSQDSDIFLQILPLSTQRSNGESVKKYRNLGTVQILKIDTDVCFFRKFQ